MDPILKDVLRNNRSLLVLNIVPTEEFVGNVTEAEVLTNSMLDDVQNQPTREEKNARLLDLLLLRGSGVLTKFCDALQLSGHNFLADLLRDEASLLASQEEGSTDESKKYAKLDKLIQKPNKEEIAAYITEKVRAEVVRLTWGRETLDKEKALDAKQQQLEDTWKYKEIIKEKDDTIKGLETSLNAAMIESEEKGSEIKSLNTYIDDLKDKHKDNLDAQMNFNVANDKSLRRMTEREMENNKVLQDMMNNMDQCVQRHPIPKQSDDPGGSHDHHEEDPRSVTICDKAAHKLRAVLRVVEHLDQFKVRCKVLESDQAQIKHMIHMETDAKETIPTTLRGFIAKQDQLVSQLQSEVTALKREVALREDLPDMDVIIEMRDSLSKLRTDKQSLETQVRNLEEDIKRLKLIIGNYKNRAKNGHPDVPPEPTPRTHAPSKKPAQSHSDSAIAIPTGQELVPPDSAKEQPRAPSQVSYVSYQNPGNIQHFNLPPLQKSIKPMLPMKLSLDSTLSQAASKNNATRNGYKYNPPPSGRLMETSSTQLVTGSKMYKVPKHTQISSKYHEPKKLTYLKN